MKLSEDTIVDAERRERKTSYYQNKNPGGNLAKDVRVTTE